MRTPNVMRGISTVGVLLVLTLLAGCKAPGDIDNTVAPVSLILTSLSAVGGNFGDVVNDDGTVSDTPVVASFVARLKSSNNTTAPELQEIVIERYEVTYARTDGGERLPAGMQRALVAKVQVTPNGVVTERTTTVTITLVPASQKLQPPLSHLISPGFEPDTGFPTVTVDATLRFFGHTVAGDQVAVQGAITIQFANYAGDEGAGRGAGGRQGGSN